MTREAAIKFKKENLPNDVINAPEIIKGFINLYKSENGSISDNAFYHATKDKALGASVGMNYLGTFPVSIDLSDNVGKKVT